MILKYRLSPTLHHQEKAKLAISDRLITARLGRSIIYRYRHAFLVRKEIVLENVTKTTSHKHGHFLYPVRNLAYSSSSDNPGRQKPDSIYAEEIVEAIYTGTE